MTRAIIRSNTLSDGKYYITSIRMDEIVRDFTGTPRHWPAYSADKVEVMARHAGAIPQTAWYAGFDPVNDMLIFKEPTSAEYFQINEPEHPFDRFIFKVQQKVRRTVARLRGRTDH